MKVLDDHHHYLLEGFEKADNTQEIKFIKKVPVDQNGNLETVHDGTTNEEVLRMLIHRMYGLNAKFPSFHNEMARTHMEQALAFLEERTRERKSRGVEGKHLK